MVLVAYPNPGNYLRPPLWALGIVMIGRVKRHHGLAAISPALWHDGRS